MVPRVVRNETQRDVARRQTACLVEVQQLRIGPERRERINLLLLRHEGEGRIDGELLLLVEQDAAQVEVVVGPLGAIDQRTALHADAPSVGLHTLVGLHQTGRHVEMQAHGVALLPPAVNDGISRPVDIGGQRLAVDGDAPRERLPVGVFIELRRHGLALHPSGDADVHGKGA